MRLELTARRLGAQRGPEAGGRVGCCFLAAAGRGIVVHERAAGLLGVATPSHLVNLLARWHLLTGLPVTLALRLGFGTLLVLGAPFFRFPD